IRTTCTHSGADCSSSGTARSRWRSRRCCSFGATPDHGRTARRRRRERYGAREMIWMWLGPRPLVAPPALVSVLLLLTPRPRRPAGAASRSAPVALSAVLGTLETLPLVLRRKRPALVLACVTAVALAMSALGIWGVPLALGVALYTLATTRPPRAQQTLAY